MSLAGCTHKKYSLCKSQDAENRLKDRRKDDVPSWKDTGLENKQFSILSIHKSLGPDRMQPQERQRCTGDSPTKGHKDHEGTRTCLHNRNGSECRDCFAWRRKGSGWSHQVYKYLKGECKEGRATIFFSGAQWQDHRQQSQAETREVPSEHQETPFSL